MTIAGLNLLVAHHDFQLDLPLLVAHHYFQSDLPLWTSFLTADHRPPKGHQGAGGCQALIDSERARGEQGSGLGPGHFREQC